METEWAVSMAASWDSLKAGAMVDWSGIGWVVCLVGKKEHVTVVQWAALMDEQWAASKGLVMDAKMDASMALSSAALMALNMADQRGLN